MSSIDAALAVHLHRIHFRFQGAPEALFEDFSFALPRGRWTTLLGTSGVGKSTLLRLIGGLEALQQGEYQRAKNLKLAYMPQRDALLPWLSLLDNVQLPYHLAGSKNSETTQRAEALLQAVGLADCLHQAVTSLSGGQKQRASLARTLMQNAELILMDEPFSAVDAITRAQLQQLAQTLLADKTVLLITHDPHEALRLSDDIYVLRGKPVQLSRVLSLHRSQSWAERLPLEERLWQMLAVL